MNFFSVIEIFLLYMVKDRSPIFLCFFYISLVGTLMGATYFSYIYIADRENYCLVTGKAVMIANPKTGETTYEIDEDCER